MARPIKQGVDYFPLDCHVDDNVKLIQAEFGLVGFAILVKIWQKIYSDKGYFTEWVRDVASVFSQENGVSAGVVHEVVRACLDRGIFDREMFQRFKILTSEGIQKRYAAMTDRRTLVKIDQRYLLIVAPSNWVFDYNNLIIADNNAVNAGRNTQSKVKESKVNYNSIARAREDSSFDTDEFFNAAVRRALGDIEN